VELDAVHGESGRRFFPAQQGGSARRQRLQLADARVDAFHDGSWAHPLGQLRDDGFAHEVGVHPLREHLEGKDVVVAVDDEARKEICFAEDDPVSVAIADDLLAVRDGVGDALAQQGWKIGDRLMRCRLSGNHADGDLR